MQIFLLDYSATYLPGGESHFISSPYTTTTRFYKANLLQTNATYGFRIVFHNLYLRYDGDKGQIGTGNDPSDNQSVITTIQAYTYFKPDDVYVGSNEMWFTVIGGKVDTNFRMDVEIISIDLSSECEIILDLSYLNNIFVGYQFIA